MTTDQAIANLAEYAIQKNLIDSQDRIYAQNAILETLKKSDFHPVPPQKDLPPLAEILEVLLQDALQRGVIEDLSYAKDQLDTALMGRLTPRPSEIIKTFKELYAQNPKAATDWYYKLSQDSNYIRRDRIAKDRKWTVGSDYGDIEITINLSKPEKDPKEIAMARELPKSAYPICALCIENEGYAGRMDHPARQNHRLIPVSIDGQEWKLQYSPYVYYNEHCIVLNSEHTPMKIDKQTFEKLLSFVEQFPHYFVGSNADLPIVGGSILAHEHFQGGHHTFPMAQAEIDLPFFFNGYKDVKAGILDWPLSVVRLQSENKEKLIELADHILKEWREYSDPACEILAYTGETPHNTITPIARKKGDLYELDLVLRNNRTSEAYPDGIFHPHKEIHPIKKENIGLIEVMGLAVLPARLDQELSLLAQALKSGEDLDALPETAKHKEWVYSVMSPEEWKKLDISGIERRLEEEAGKMFVKGLEHAGVFKNDTQGQRGLLQFLEITNAML